MKNHEIVDANLVNSIAKLNHGGCLDKLLELSKRCLVAYETKGKTSETDS